MNRFIRLAFILLISLGSLIILQKRSSQDSFELWKQQYGVTFESSEEPYRKLIFQKNLEKIEIHNSDSSQTYKMKINQFSIYSDQEFKQRFLMTNFDLSGLAINEIQNFGKKQIQNDENINIPSGPIDWTTQGKVSRVKNQGNCGSCWAFSTTGALQSYALFYNRQVDLSQQQLVDCSTRYGNNGCSGGYPMQAFKYVYDNGLASESQYPYAARNQNCQRNGGSFRITNVYSFPGCSNLVNGLSAQPLSVTVDATNWSQYHSGVFNNCSANINHCVLLVGIDGSGTWKIKNSWGTSWGEGGYIRLQPGDTCGLCNYAGIYPR